MTLLTLIRKTWTHHPVRSAVMVLAIAIASFYLAKSPILYLDIEGRQGRAYRVDDLGQQTLSALRKIDAPITFVSTVVLTLSADEGEPVRLLVTAYHPIGQPNADLAVLSQRLIELLEKQGGARLARGEGKLRVDWGEGEKAIRYRTEKTARSWERVPLGVLQSAARVQGAEIRANTYAARPITDQLTALLGEPIDRTTPQRWIGLRLADSDALVAVASWMLIGLLLLFAVHFDRTARQAELTLIKHLGATSGQQRRLLIGDLACSIVLGMLCGLALFVTIDDQGLERLSSLGGTVAVAVNLAGASVLVLLVAYVSTLRWDTKRSLSASPAPDHRRWLLAGIAAFVVGIVLISRMNPSWLPLSLRGPPWKVGLLLLSLVVFFGAGGFLVARLAGLLFGRLWAAGGTRGSQRFALVGVRWLRGMDVVAAMVLAISIGVVITGAAYSHSWTSRRPGLPQIEALDFLPRVPPKWLRANTQLSADEIEPLRLVDLSSTLGSDDRTEAYLLAAGPKTLRAWQALLSSPPSAPSRETVYWQAGVRYMPEVRGLIPPGLRRHEGRVRGVGAVAAGVISWQLADRLAASAAESKLRIVQQDLGLYVFAAGGLKTRAIDGSLRRWDSAKLFYHAPGALRPQPPKLHITAFRQQGKNPTLLGLLGLGMLTVVLAGVSLQQQRRRDVPFLKQLGATRGQIFWGSWIEQALVCVLAAVGGCLLALLPAYMLLRTAATFFDVAAPQLLMPWSWIAQLSALAVALPAIVLALLWWRTSGVSELPRHPPSF